MLQYTNTPNSVGPTDSDISLLARFRQLRDTNNSSIREELMHDHLRLVRSVARRFSTHEDAVDDLVQEGTIGLLEAIDRYNPDRGVKFSTYAFQCISSRIQHYLRDCSGIIRQPGWVQEARTKLQKVTGVLAQQLARDPSVEELAEHLEIPERRIQELLALRNLDYILSLTASPQDDANENDFASGEEHLRTAVPSGTLLSVEDQVALHEAISSLTEREQEVIRLFYFEGLSFTDIAKNIGVSVNYASYLVRRAVTNLKSNLTDPVTIQEDAVEPGAATAQVNTPQEHIQRQIVRSKGKPTTFALMLLELQDFDCADENAEFIVNTVGQICHAATRRMDIILHEGNGRFVLLFPHTGHEAEILGKRLSQAISAKGLTTSSGETLFASYGFAVFPMNGASVKTLYSTAEEALAKAICEAPVPVSRPKSYEPYVLCNTDTRDLL